MPASGPSFSPYPFEHLRRLSRADAAFESALARFVDGKAGWSKLEKVCEGPVSIRIVGGAPAIDPHAALAEVRVGGASIVIACSSRAVRELAQRVLGGPDELDAPRPLGAPEIAIWCLVVAAAVEDAGIAGQVWPILDETVANKPRVAKPSDTVASSPRGRAAAIAHADTRPAVAPRIDPALRTVIDRIAGSDARALEFAASLGGLSATVAAFVPRSIELRVPARRIPGWTFEVPIVLGRAAIPRDAVANLGVKAIVTIERVFELEIGDGAVGLSATPKAVEAKVVTGYVRRDMALPDDAHLELTVQLGTKRMSLRELTELAPGQIISLGRPLAGPFQVRVGGREVGQGELVDIDGEVGVRIVSLAQE